MRADHLLCISEIKNFACVSILLLLEHFFPCSVCRSILVIGTRNFRTYLMLVLLKICAHLF